MAAGLLITFREGLEAFLVVGIILTYLGRCNQKQYNKWVYMGVFLGLLSAFALGFLFQIYYNGFESKLGELYLKVGIMGFAVVVLTYMVIWMSKNGRNIKGDVEKNLEHVISTGSVFALVFMSFLAILREGFETVLFLGALFGNEMNAPVFYGGALGLVIALVLTIAIFKGMRNSPIKTFFNITGGLVTIIAAGLLVNMIGILQDLNLLPVLKPAIFDLSWFMLDSSEVGIFFKALFGYTHAPSLIQVISYLSYFAVITMFFSFWEKKIQQKREVVRA
jgi:high-affinity iron transporter